MIVSGTKSLEDFDEADDIFESVSLTRLSGTAKESEDLRAEEMDDFSADVAATKLSETSNDPEKFLDLDPDLDDDVSDT